MRGLVAIGVTAAALAGTPVVPHAEDSGPHVGVRTGWSIPYGDLEKGAKLGDTVKGDVPIWLDLGARILREVELSAMLQWGYAPLENCPSGVTCRGQDVRAGLAFSWHFMPDEPYDPYAGAGVAFEVLNVKVGGRSTTYRGFEWLNLQAGLDWSTGQNFRLGPFASYGIGQFYWRNATSLAGGDMHHWLTFGLRAVFGL